MANSYAAVSASGQTPLTRRELLNYVWLGSVGVFCTQLAGATILFSLPRFKAGEFGGTFTVGAPLPTTDAAPLAYNEGKFWLVNTDEGLLAIYRVCTHLGCLYNWQASQDKFICPCHGSQFYRGGKYILGPAPRSLDAFNVQVLDAGGNLVTDTKAEVAKRGDSTKNYAPVPVQEGQQILVNTGDLIKSSGHDDGFS